MSWISKNICLPEDNSQVVVLFACNSKEIVYYNKKDGFTKVNYRNIGDNITHWLPIPPSPKLDKLDNTEATAVVRIKYERIYCPQCEEWLNSCGCEARYNFCPHCTQKLLW